MKCKCLNAAAVMFILAATTSCGTAPDVREPSSQQTILVTVNGTAITQEEIDAEIEKKTAGASDKMAPEQLAQIKARMQEKAVENFIAKTVLTMECERNDISASPQEIDAALDEMTKTLPEGMTLQDALNAGGMTLDSLKNDIAFSLRVNKLIEANVDTITPPAEAEILQFYEENKNSFKTPESVQARHILIKASKDDDAATRAKKRTRIEALRIELINGADFATIAAQNSDCPSKSRGGNLGPFGRGRMVKEFEEAAFRQPLQEIGPVVETSFGFHIIQVQARTSAGQRPFDEVKDQIRTHLEQKNKNIAVRDYIEKLKSEATIVYAVQ